MRELCYGDDVTALKENIKEWDGQVDELSGDVTALRAKRSVSSDGASGTADQSKIILKQKKKIEILEVSSRSMMG